MDANIGRNVNIEAVKINTVYCENNIVTFSRIDDEFIDLIVTSPPYDDLREYNGIEWDYKKVISEAFRTLKTGGVMVWVVGDATKDTGETGSSFMQAIFAIKIGFNLHDTMIYKKQSPAYPANINSKRYSQVFEYMFVFSKGTPKTVNLLTDKENSCKGQKYKNTKIKEFSIRDNIWQYNTGGLDRQKDKIATLHPAIFPELLAADHIKTWSNENDIIYDPFAGSGTTLKVAKDLNRKYIGSEISDKYVNIINERLNSLKF